MAVIKHEFPILEVDTEAVAVIMPNRDNSFVLPKKCVFAFLGENVEQFIEGEHLELVANFECITKSFPIYKTIYKGEEICFCQAPLGSSAATQILDYLIAYGVQEIIACGSCGALQDFEENQIMIPTAALRDEGASYHYLPPSRFVGIDETAREAIKKSAVSMGIDFVECITWTTDGFFRETKDMVSYRIEEGCGVVEMECSGLAACAKFRGATFGQILFTADSLAAIEEWNERDWGKASYHTVFKLSMEAVYLIGK